MIETLSALLLCQLAGELAVRLAGLPLPGPVVGTALLLGLLALRGGVPAPLGDAARVLLTNLSLLFVPAGTGVMVHADRVRAEWLPIAVALVASAALTIAVTALVFAAVSRLAGSAEEHRP